MTFRATCVTWSVEDNTATLGFADDPVEMEHYLLLVRELSPAAQDRALGMDRLYVELDSQANSSYGEIEEAELSEHAVRLRFDPATAGGIAGGEVVEIVLAADPALRGRVREGLSMLVASG